MHFAWRTPEERASVALLVEHSRSSWYLGNIESAMLGFLNAAPEGHWYALASFGRVLHIDGDFTRQKGEIRNGFSQLQWPLSDEINTYDSVAAGSALRGRIEPYLGTSARMDVLQAEAFLRMLANTSGGQAWFPRFESAFSDVLTGIFQIIDNQYRLVYRPRVPRDGDLHEIRVEAFAVADDRRQHFDARVRKGWRLGS